MSIGKVMQQMLGECDFVEIRNLKDAYKNLPDHELGEHWYDSIKLEESVSKKGKKEQSAAFDKLTGKYFEAYLACADSAETGIYSVAAKKQKAAVYVEGLLANGGPSTDVFKKEFGEEKTAYLFRNILFGTGEK